MNPRNHLRRDRRRKLVVAIAVIAVGSVGGSGFVTQWNLLRSMAVVFGGFLLARGTARLSKRPERLHALSFGLLSAGMFGSFLGMLDGMNALDDVFDLVRPAAFAPWEQVPHWTEHLPRVAAAMVAALFRATWLGLSVLFARSAFVRWGAPRADQLPAHIARQEEEQWLGAADRPDRFGLACSGGGIRAASFSIGVLCGLQRAQLLGKLDMVAGVSGGAWSLMGWWLADDNPAELARKWGSDPDFLGLQRPTRSPFARALAGSLLRNLAVLAGGSMILMALTWSFINSAYLASWKGMGGEDVSATAAVLEWAACDERRSLPCWVVDPESQCLGSQSPACFLLAPTGLPSIESDSEQVRGVSKELHRVGPLVGTTATAAFGWASVGVALAWALLWQRPREAADILQRCVTPVLATSLAWSFLIESRLFAALLFGWPITRLLGILAGRRRWIALVIETIGMAGVLVAFVIAPPQAALVAGAAFRASLIASYFRSTQALGAGSSLALWSIILVPASCGLAGLVSLLLNRDRLALHDAWRDAIAATFGIHARLGELRRGRERGRPFPILVTAANVPGASSGPYRHRRTVLVDWTPVTVGCENLGWSRTSAYEALLGVGDVVALSSAAVSSQMGLAWPAPLQRLLGILNLRLGQWLPNPLWVGTSESARDVRVGFFPRLASELARTQNESDPELLFTDGGHDDNTGLLSLVRRGCTRIVLANADLLNVSKHGQLLNALRRLQYEHGFSYDEADIRTQLGTPEWLDRKNGGQRAAIEVTLRRGAETVQILALNLAIPSDAPAEVRSAVAMDEHFPWHPTHLQSFSSEIFSAYVTLGAYHDRELTRWFAADGRCCATEHAART